MKTSMFLFILLLVSSIFTSPLVTNVRFLDTLTVEDMKTMHELGFDPTAFNLTYWNWLLEHGFDPNNWMKYDVDVYWIEYFTHTPYVGEQVKVSGYLALPKTTLEMPLAMILLGTMQSLIYSAEYYPAIWASAGMIAFTPHFIGQQKSHRKVVESYYIDQGYQNIGVDIYNAVLEYLDQSNIPYKDGLLFYGISEGGFAIAAMAKKFQELQINVTMVAEVAGPLNFGFFLRMFVNDVKPKNTEMTFLSLKCFTSYASYVPNTTYPFTSLYQTENKQQKINYNHNIVRPELRDLTVDAYLDEIHQFDKMWAIEPIYNELPPEGPKQFWEFYNPELKYAILTMQNDHPFLAYGNTQNMEDWKPEMPFNIYHSVNDDKVPYGFSVLSYRAFLAKGSTSVKLVTFTGVNHIHTQPPARKAVTDEFFARLAA